MKLLGLFMMLLMIGGCAHPPQVITALDIQKSADGLVLVKLKVTNLEDRVTVPIALDLSGQARTNGQWSKPETLLHPAAFVLNRKEQREITKLWRVPAEGVRTTVTLKEQENGNILRNEKAEKIFDGSPGLQPATSPR